MLTSSEMSTSASSGGLSKLDEFLEEGSKLQLDALSSSPTMNNMILLTTTETSTLLAQVRTVSLSLYLAKWLALSSRNLMTVRVRSPQVNIISVQFFEASKKKALNFALLVFFSNFLYCLFSLTSILSVSPDLFFIACCQSYLIKSNLLRLSQPLRLIFLKAHALFWRLHSQCRFQITGGRADRRHPSNVSSPERCLSQVF